MFTEVLILCCLLGLGTQPSTCYARQSTSGVEGELRQIREILEGGQAILTGMATSLSQIAGTLEVTTAPTTTEDTDPSITVATTTDPSTIVATDPSTTVATTTDTSMTTDPTPITPSDTCGGPGWRKVAFINMSDPNQDCPQGLNETGYSIRSCGRSHSGYLDCSSVTFPVSEQYSRVCGRVRAYRFGHNYAFLGYNNGGRDINGAYIDGLSLTHSSGEEHTHIWSFASGLFYGTSDDSLDSHRCLVMKVTLMALLRLLEMTTSVKAQQQ